MLRSFPLHFSHTLGLSLFLLRHSSLTGTKAGQGWELLKKLSTEPFWGGDHLVPVASKVTENRLPRTSRVLPVPASCWEHPAWRRETLPLLIAHPGSPALSLQVSSQPGLTHPPRTGRRTETCPLTPTLPLLLVHSNRGQEAVMAWAAQLHAGDAGMVLSAGTQLCC